MWHCDLQDVLHLSSHAFVDDLCCIVAFRKHFIWLRPLLSVVYATWCLSGCTSPDYDHFYRRFMEHDSLQDVLHLTPPAFIRGLCNSVFQDVLHLIPPAFIDGLCNTMAFRMYFPLLHPPLSVFYVTRWLSRCTSPEFIAYTSVLCNAVAFIMTFAWPKRLCVLFGWLNHLCITWTRKKN
jgi:hypothetical protein